VNPTSTQPVGGLTLEIVMRGEDKEDKAAARTDINARRPET
jgi:hypothetical protein